MPNDFAKKFIEQLFGAIEVATKKGYAMIWDLVKYVLSEHLWLVLGFLFFILLASFIEYVFTGRWKKLGSVLYTYFYGFIMFLVALIFGTDVFANDWFAIIALLIYAFCFWLVGRVLESVHVKKV